MRSCICNASTERLRHRFGVAIKILPPEVSADPDRRARFAREAKTIAGLSHPHICSLFDVGEHDGSMFLVMEHLTGETLAERLLEGPLPVEHALTLATEIAEGLLPRRECLEPVTEGRPTRGRV